MRAIAKEPDGGGPPSRRPVVDSRHCPQPLQEQHCWSADATESAPLPDGVAGLLALASEIVVTHERFTSVEGLSVCDVRLVVRVSDQ